MTNEENNNKSVFEEIFMDTITMANDTIISLMDCVIYLTKYINELEESKKD